MLCFASVGFFNTNKKLLINFNTVLDSVPKVKKLCEVILGKFKSEITADCILHSRASLAECTLSDRLALPAADVVIV